jgi:hypothetical protein
LHSSRPRSHWPNGVSDSRGAPADALADAIARHDGDAINWVVGHDYRRYIPAANVDPDEVTDFLEDWARAQDRSGR